MRAFAEFLVFQMHDFRSTRPPPADKGNFPFLAQACKCFHFFQLMEHVFYDDPCVHESMVDDTVNTTSVRHPLGQLTSQFHYSKAKYGHKSKSQIIARLEKRYQNLEAVNFSEEGMKYLYLPKNISTNATATFLKEKLEKLFKLVMITEHFDESLILLRKTLCWELKDLLYVPLKVGIYHQTGNELRGKIAQTRLEEQTVSKGRNHLKIFHCTSSNTSVRVFNSTANCSSDFLCSLVRF